MLFKKELKRDKKEMDRRKLRYLIKL